MRSELSKNTSIEVLKMFELISPLPSQLFMITWAVYGKACKVNRDTCCYYKMLIRFPNTYT